MVHDPAGKTDNMRSFIYYIYKATEPIARVDGFDEIAKAMAVLDTPWEGRGAEREARKAKAREQANATAQLSKTIRDQKAA